MQAIHSSLKASDKSLSVTGLQGSSQALVQAAIYNKATSTNLFLANDQETAAYLYNDLVQILGMDEVLFFPSAYKKSIKYGQIDSANEILRTDVLNRLSVDKSKALVVSYPEAITEKVITTTALREKILQLTVGECVDTEFIIEVLMESGFERVDFVYEPGQFSNRGSIIDIFSFSNEMPFRVDFFGNEVETIRLFDIETQLSTESRQSVSIVPDIHRDTKAETISFLEFLASDSLLLFNDYLFVRDRINQVYDDALVSANQSENKKSDLKSHLITGDDFLHSIAGFKKLEFVSKKSLPNSDLVEFKTSPQPLYHKNFDLVLSSFKEYLSDAYKIYIQSDSVKQTDRIKAIFEDKGENISFTAVLKTLHEGFVDHDLSCCFFSDHQLFDRFHKYSLK